MYKVNSENLALVAPLISAFLLKLVKKVKCNNVVITKLILYFDDRKDQLPAELLTATKVLRERR